MVYPSKLKYLVLLKLNVFKIRVILVEVRNTTLLTAKMLHKYNEIPMC